MFWVICGWRGAIFSWDDNSFSIVIIIVLPLGLDGFGHHILADFVVDIGLVSLAQLVTARNAVHTAVFDEPRARLVKAESHVVSHALFPDVKNPVVVARSRLGARLAACGHLLNIGREVWRKVDVGEHRGHHYALVLDGHIQENRQPVVGHCLILDGATHQHVVVAVAPIVGHALQKAVNAFGEEVEPKVAALAYHPPALGAPLVGIFQQKIGREASEDNPPRWNLPTLVALAFQRQIEISCLAAFAARNLTAVHLVLTIDIAIFAAGANLGAAVPRIPIGVYLPFF